MAGNWSIWTTLTNTAKAIPDRFYVVIDEAHRGMAGGKGAKEAQTLMQRFLLGVPRGRPDPDAPGDRRVRDAEALHRSPGARPAHPAQGGQCRWPTCGYWPAEGPYPDSSPKVAGHSEMSLLEEAARAWVRMSQA